MSEPILKALMQLFALITDTREDAEITLREKNLVRSFLGHHLNKELTDRYMKVFEDYLAFFNSERIDKGSLKEKKRTSLNAMKLLAICEKINNELHQKQKIYVLVQLVGYIALGTKQSENELDFLHTVAIAFNIPDKEYDNIRSFIMLSAHSVPEKKKVLIIDNKTENFDQEMKHLCNVNLIGTISFLHIESTNTYILKYSGEADIFLNGQKISVGQTYVFDNGSSIRASGINTVYFSEVVSLITETSFKTRVAIDAHDVFYRFMNSENGIHGLNLHEESGRLVGIMGGSGAGKSTTLSILNGTLRPQSGTVLVNGYNLYDEQDKEALKGVIGFVPQDDLLIEELTVFQNLFFNARLCLSNLPEEKVVEIVNKTLLDFDLEETRNLIVGSPLNKIISGGQRKRLNIALELLREPNILFVDEPTSGLSSVDSEIVMNLLDAQTYKGKLVIVNIHQPSSEIYKMFDRILIIDKGGYQVFYGNPTEAIIYFKRHSNHANPEEDQCSECGNVDSDQILQIIEAKVVDEHGKATRIRKVSPKEWAEKFRENNFGIAQKFNSEKRVLPDNSYSIPGLFKQSRIFFIRDLLSKLANRQYALISLLGAPFLAFLLAYFTKYKIDGQYHFSENENLPSYLFMSVITSLFMGLIISAEEIVKDRKILKRESFLNLSWFSYLNSKVMIMFLISAIQTILFIIIGNYILEIKGMTGSYFIILFTTSCLANMLGLNISSAFNSVITIYILIPFIIIPQLLFSGVLVKFEKLHQSKLATSEYVPIIGEVMAARWSFEALAVEQFKNNNYERSFIDVDIERSQNDWYANYLIVSLKSHLQECSLYKDSTELRKNCHDNFTKLNYYIDRLNTLAGFGPINGSWKASLNEEKFNEVTGIATGKFLDSLRTHFRLMRKMKMAERDKIDEGIGKERLTYLSSAYENKELEKLLLGDYILKKSVETSDRIIQKYEPGFMIPLSKYGRAHLYAPYKRVGNLKIDTFVFNVLLLWVISLILYLVLYYNLLQNAIGSFENLRFIKAMEKE
jgi:ABC-type multidrug transport system ATPase subunit